ncbi:MAG: type II toxin-antitoxin system VapC family toxin [Chloroflexota bacterium]
MITYSDPSAIVGLLLRDSPDHERLVELFLGEDGPIMTSQLTVAEVTSAFMAAERGARIPSGRYLIEGFEGLCRPGNRIRLLDLRPDVVIGTACQLMERHRLDALDAIHLAVALTEAAPLADEEPVRFLTRDRTQAEAARALGFTVA